MNSENLPADIEALQLEDLTIEELDDVSAAGTFACGATISCIMSCFGDV